MLCGLNIFRLLIILSLLGQSSVLATFIPLTVQELDGSPSVTKVKNITFNGATLTDLLNGRVLVTITGGAGSAAGASGAIQFNNSNALGADSSNLFWDDTNNRLGIGTASPGQTLEVNGIGRLTSASTFSIGGDAGYHRLQRNSDDFAFLNSGNGYADLSLRSIAIGTYFGDIAAPANGISVEGNVGIGTPNTNERLTVNGASAALSLRRSTTVPSDTSKFGKIYISNGDGELYFNSDDSAAVRLTNNGSIAELEKGGYYDNILQYSLNDTPVNGIKMVTNIPFTNQTQMPTIIIEGYNYGRGSTIGLILNWYLYTHLDPANPDVINYSVSSFGGSSPEIKIARESGKVVIFINSREYFNRFHVRAYAGGLSAQKQWFEGWTARDEALTGDKIVTVPYRNLVGSLTINGETALRETSAPIATANYGKIFVNSANSRLYFQDDSGVNYNLTNGSFLAPAGTDGSIQFKSGTTFSSDSSNLFWDDTNNRLGLGTNSPARKLHISEAMRLEPQSSPPASPALGDLYVDSDTTSLCYYNGSSWTAVTPGGCN